MLELIHFCFLVEVRGRDQHLRAKHVVLPKELLVQAHHARLPRGGARVDARRLERAAADARLYRTAEELLLAQLAAADADRAARDQHHVAPGQVQLGELLDDVADAAERDGPVGARDGRGAHLDHDPLRGGEVRARAQRRALASLNDLHHRSGYALWLGGGLGGAAHERDQRVGGGGGGLGAPRQCEERVGGHLSGGEGYQGVSVDNAAVHARRAGRQAPPPVVGGRGHPHSTCAQPAERSVRRVARYCPVRARHECARRGERRRVEEGKCEEDGPHLSLASAVRRLERVAVRAGERGGEGVGLHEVCEVEQHLVQQLRTEDGRTGRGLQGGARVRPAALLEQQLVDQRALGAGEWLPRVLPREALRDGCRQRVATVASRLPVGKACGSGGQQRTAARAARRAE
mmetsp:Transcript_41461/g.102767  ORF Transcript_41461/g.102767 Transcript_41461/m.102767 type:complete len:404 (+) Transcript_41461:586-1797(+)